jgi:hypothetical protein
MQPVRRWGHVARDRFSQTHPGVEPILDDVDQPPLGTISTFISL